MNKQPDYVLGHSDAEIDRLIEQSRFWANTTRYNLENAGLAPGMRVLDIGCGAGDVSLLAAELVGPSGSVLGVDGSDVAVVLSERRAQRQGISHASFQVKDIHAFESHETFDALIGRFVLMYMPDPAQTLIRLLRHLRPGGVVVFQEIDTSSFRAVPQAPLMEKYLRWVTAALTQAGAQPHAGSRLLSIFIEAGLPEPEVVRTVPIVGSAGTALFDYLAHTVQSLLPAIEHFGLATAEEVAIETLSTRLRSEVVASGGYVEAPSLVGAWTRRA